MSIQSDLKWLRENVLTKKDLKTIKNRFNKLDKKFTDLFDFLDKDVMSTKRRLKVIEENLGIIPDLTISVNSC